VHARSRTRAHAQEEDSFDDFGLDEDKTVVEAKLRNVKMPAIR
jgi:hypothetical protein